MIETPGIYDISEEEYHKDPCFNPSASCSILQLTDERSPLHAMWKHPRFRMQSGDNEPKFDFGSAFHKIMTGRGRDIVAIDAPDWRTKDARAMRDAAHAQGKIPMKTADYGRVHEMSQEVQIQLGTHEGTFKNCQYEKTLVWKEGNLFFRIRPDCMDDECDMMWDFKATDTSAAPESYQRHIYGMGYDFRAAFYARGYQALTGRRLKEYRFIACETEPPHALAIFSLTPEAMAFAGKRVERAIEIWQACTENNHWPSYPQKVIYVTPPKWRENAQIEREILESPTE